jgi:hypothetical protein
MGYFDLNSRTIEDFKVEVVEEGSYKVIHLSIESEMPTIKYRICADLRQGPLEVIKNNLYEALNQVKNSERDHFGIYEDVQKGNSIFVIFPDGSKKQYTAQRLE